MLTRLIPYNYPEYAQKMNKNLSDSALKRISPFTISPDQSKI